MKILAILPIIALAAARLTAADDGMLPRGWNPSVADAADYLSSELKDEKSQMGINVLTAHIASLRDAELLIVYVRLSDRLDPKGRAALKDEQTRWMTQREKAARSAGKREEGGSAGAMESNTAFADATVKRIQALQERLKQIEGKTGRPPPRRVGPVP